MMSVSQERDSFSKQSSKCKIVRPDDALGATRDIVKAQQEKRTVVRTTR
ncbi:MAG: hypothetical protein LZF62_480225 [Nitrospira sp.]|nr:MAG: hypothetical protein LZF62_480225 [Nitrospira sp.]